VSGHTVRASIALACGLAGIGHLRAQPAATDELSAYRTVTTAIAAKVRPSAGGVAMTGYLGAALQRDSQGRLVIEEVQSGSPADRAGIKKTDIVTHVGGQAVKSPDAFREWLQSHGAGETVRITLLRGGQRLEVAATLAATSRPMKPNTQQAFFGVTLGEPSDVGGVRVERVANNSPAAAAGVRADDFLVKLEGSEFTRPNRLTDLLYEKRSGDTLSFTVRRDGKDVEMKATLTADGGDGRRGGVRGRGEGRGKGGAGGDGAKTVRGGFGGRGADSPPPNTIWRKDVMRLAVVGVEFPDQKHNAKVTAKDWSDALFSRGSYQNRSNATGQPIHGSLSDYFAEQSHGAFRLEGKIFDWVELSKKRGDYSQGTGTSNKAAPLIEALDKLTARDGKEILNSFDAVVFLYAGDMPRGGRGGPGGGGGGGGRGPQINRGSVYYPHAGTFMYQTKRYPYFFGPEGGDTRMTPVGAFAKPFAQLLGLPDRAARPGETGSEGLGPWCALSDTFPTARPQHLSAWAKEKLGWLKPTIIDPTVKQKLILAPVEDSATECFKVLVRPDGSEYFLLENRTRKGFDADLPGEGLLIWRVVNDRPILEESHGVEGPAGPTVHLSAVPYPSPSANAFTPETTPSSHSPLGGGLPVHITDIRRLPDGRIAFHVGYEYR
jgi:M6 family metalloprotease-like protein